MTVLALIGAKALLLLWVWMASAIVSSLVSDRKGFGEKWGLASGLLLSIIAVFVWLVVPAKPDSKWKTEGPIRRRGPSRDASA